jgi:DNA-binding response OmpR family regulator
MLISDAFSEAGFDVIEAEDADVALSVLNNDAPRIHALFSDVNMPGSVDGIMLAEQVRQIWPKIDILLTSGLTHPNAQQLQKGIRFIPKPYDICEVVSYLQSCR